MEGSPCVAVGLRPQLLLCLDEKNEVGGKKKEGKEINSVTRFD